MHNVFVYGSLKQGFHNNTLLKTQKFIGKFSTAKAIYQMLHLGIYPGVTRQGSSYIEGELYQVSDSCLDHLDELEDNGKIYKRELIELNNYPDPCWTYLLINEDIVFPETQKKFHVYAKESCPLYKIMSWELDNK